MQQRRQFMKSFLAAAGGLLATTAVATAAHKEIVRFRLTEWKSLHMDDGTKAKQIAKTLKKLGCEAKEHSHHDHFDVRYRCVKWRSMTLQTHAQAHKWENWLKKLKFETQHEH